MVETVLGEYKLVWGRIRHDVLLSIADDRISVRFGKEREVVVEYSYKEPTFSEVTATLYENPDAQRGTIMEAFWNIIIGEHQTIRYNMSGVDG